MSTLNSSPFDFSCPFENSTVPRPMPVTDSDPNSSRMTDSASPLPRVKVWGGFPAEISRNVTDSFASMDAILTFSSCFVGGSKCSLAIPLIRFWLNESQASRL